MIIDQLPLLSGDIQATDEIPIERGTTTYKTTQASLVKSAADAAAAAQQTADSAQQTASSKQDALVSGVNIKTVGGQSLLGSGNIDVGGGLYLTNFAVSATTGDIATVSNSEITANHVVAECVFANPSAITTNVTWTTAAGSLVLNGTCATATAVNLVLVKTN